MNDYLNTDKGCIMEEICNKNDKNLDNLHNKMSSLVKNGCVPTLLAIVILKT